MGTQGDLASLWFCPRAARGNLTRIIHLVVLAAGDKEVANLAKWFSGWRRKPKETIDDEPTVL